VQRMIERRIEGVAILSFENEDSLIGVFRQRDVSVFALDVESEGPILKAVCIDYKYGIRQAVQHLAALGHSRIAFVSGPAYLKLQRVENRLSRMHEGNWSRGTSATARGGR
jgi:LacI family transcriptional regulator